MPWRTAWTSLGHTLRRCRAAGPCSRVRGKDVIEGNPFELWADMIADRVAVKITKLQAREKKRLYSIEEAAEYLSLSPAQVYRLAVAGKLKSLREGRRRLVDRDELDRWIAARANQG